MTAGGNGELFNLFITLTTLFILNKSDGASCAVSKNVDDFISARAHSQKLLTQMMHRLRSDLELPLAVVV